MPRGAPFPLHALAPQLTAARLDSRPALHATHCSRGHAAAWPATCARAGPSALTPTLTLTLVCRGGTTTWGDALQVATSTPSAHRQPEAQQQEAEPRKHLSSPAPQRAQAPWMPATRCWAWFSTSADPQRNPTSQIYLVFNLPTHVRMSDV